MRQDFCQACRDDKGIQAACLLQLLKSAQLTCQTTDSHKYCEALRVSTLPFLSDSSFQRVMVGTAVQGAHENQAEREHQPES